MLLQTVFCCAPGSDRSKKGAQDCRALTRGIFYFGGTTSDQSAPVWDILPKLKEFSYLAVGPVRLWPACANSRSIPGGERFDTSAGDPSRCWPWCVSLSLAFTISHPIREDTIAFP